MTRTERYMARIRAHLPTLQDDDARRLFLTEQFDAWEFLYGRFQIAQAWSDSRPAGSDAPTAFDYVETLTELAGLRAQYERKAA